MQTISCRHTDIYLAIVGYSLALVFKNMFLFHFLNNTIPVCVCVWCTHACALTSEICLILFDFGRLLRPFVMSSDQWTETACPRARKFGTEVVTPGLIAAWALPVAMCFNTSLAE